MLDIVGGEPEQANVSGHTYTIHYTTGAVFDYTSERACAVRSWYFKGENLVKLHFDGTRQFTSLLLYLWKWVWLVSLSSF